MSLEIKEVTQREFDIYWTQDVRDVLAPHIQDMKLWAKDFDKPGSKRRWVIDEDAGITFISVNALLGIEHPSEFCWEDAAVVARNGAVGLLQHKDGEGFYDIYNIIVLTDFFSESIESFKKIFLEAIDKGGIRFNGGNIITNKLYDACEVVFFDLRG